MAKQTHQFDLPEEKMRRKVAIHLVNVDIGVQLIFQTPNPAPPDQATFLCIQETTI